MHTVYHIPTNSHTVLEFIYAQSPESMKGLLTGLYYFFLGLTSIVSSAMYYLYKDNLDQNKVLLPFYTAFTIIQVWRKTTPKTLLEVCRYSGTLWK